MTSSTRIRVGIEPGSDFDVQAWRRRAALGRVPDRSPYGLERMAEHGVDVVTFGEHGQPGGRCGRLLATALTRSRMDLVPLVRPGLSDVDVVLTMNEKRGVPLRRAVALRARRVRVVVAVVWVTDPSPDVPAVAQRLIRRELAKAHALAVHCSAQLPVLRSWGVPDERLHLVPFGVDTSWWTPGTAGGDGPRYVLSAGTDRNRDYPSLLAAWQRVRRPGVELQVAGPTDLPAAPGVVLLGKVPHERLRELYRGAAAVVIPTRHNVHASGLTCLLEASACGRPVLTGDTPGIVDYLPEAEHRYPVGDVAGLSERLDLLLREPGAAEALGARAGDRVRRSHDHEDLSRRLAAVCRATLA